jgi:hypothetical protein
MTPSQIPAHSHSRSRPIAQSDIPLQRILSARNWRARFFEAAANASASIVKYSLKNHDAITAAVWMDRFQFFREKAKACI